MSEGFHTTLIAAIEGLQRRCGLALVALTLV